MKPAEFERLPDEGLREIQDRLESHLLPYRHCDLVDGVLLTDQELSRAATNYVAHGLGRTPQGWIIVRINAAATVYEAQDPDDRYLYLTTSADATVSLWVF